MELCVFIHVSWWTAVCHEAVFTADILTHHSGKSTGVADTNEDGRRQSSADKSRRYDSEPSMHKTSTLKLKHLSEIQSQS